jgi:hypothetical protein
VNAGSISASNSSSSRLSGAHPPVANNLCIMAILNCQCRRHPRQGLAGAQASCRAVMKPLAELHKPVKAPTSIVLSCDHNRKICTSPACQDAVSTTFLRPCPEANGIVTALSEKQSCCSGRSKQIWEPVSRLIKQPACSRVDFRTQSCSNAPEASSPSQSHGC